jgi:hypothetical protein
MGTQILQNLEMNFVATTTHSHIYMCIGVRESSGGRRRRERENVRERGELMKLCNDRRDAEEE